MLRKPNTLAVRYQPAAGHFPVVEDAINVTSFCQTTGNGSLLAVYAERTRMRKLPFDHDDHVNEEQIEYLNHPFEANVAFRFAFAKV